MVITLIPASILCQSCCFEGRGLKLVDSVGHDVVRVMVGALMNRF